LYYSGTVRLARKGDIMDKLLYTFEIVVLLFKDGQVKKISKAVPSIYQDSYREVGYSFSKKLLEEGWRIYSISIENILLKKDTFSIGI
jgi:hypothetical protein